MRFRKESDNKWFFGKCKLRGRHHTGETMIAPFGVIMSTSIWNVSWHLLFRRPCHVQVSGCIVNESYVATKTPRIMSLCRTPPGYRKISLKKCRVSELLGHEGWLDERSHEKDLHEAQWQCSHWLEQLLFNKYEKWLTWEWCMRTHATNNRL